VVIVIEVIIRALLHKQRITSPSYNRHITIGFGDIPYCIDFRHQPFIGIDKVGSDPVYFFPKPSTKGIIVVLGFYSDKPFRPPERPFFRGDP